MHSIPSRPVDISFVGALDPSMNKELSLLTELGIAIAKLSGAVNVSFQIDGMDASNLPAEISKYVKNLTEPLPIHFGSVRVAIFFDESTTDSDLVKAASNAGAYVIVDEALAAKNRWLAPSTFAVINSSGELLASISEYFGSPLTDLFISVALASRDAVVDSMKKCEETLDLFPNIEGVRQFYQTLQQRLKSVG